MPLGRARPLHVPEPADSVFAAGSMQRLSVLFLAGVAFADAELLVGGNGFIGALSPV